MLYYGAFETAEEAHDALDQIYETYRDRGNVRPEHITLVCEDRIRYNPDPKLGWNNPDDFRVVRNGKYWSIMTPDPSVITKIFSTTIRPKNDPVDHPAHYISENGQIEVIDVIEAFTSDLHGIEAVCTANVIKYICRWKHKNGVQDLEKARWYLNRLINRISKEEN